MHRLPDLPGRTAIPVEHFNTAPAEEIRHLLLACLRSAHWAARIADHRPYPDADALLAAADEAAYDLTWADLADALANESLPALPADTYSAAHTALSAARAAYEARFGHVFVICLDGVAPEESLDRVLEAIRSRLTNDPEEERAITAEQLRRLARGRLVRALKGTGRCRYAAPPRGATSR
ncbi:2-oxo-4-hydroxy-4-carboxy-5-ureidoimidazoline decarboxylase [Streptomyces bullii]|uniref:2-oxo-4-hydroxy-4-carboxy-5-ureidoimidazoline decarboxylase n=1 Tax=Streptomyces bullii TaxID=349910 RepID=A0ABW0UR23_9ACTN